MTFSSKGSSCLCKQSFCHFLMYTLYFLCVEGAHPPKMMVIVSSERPLDWRRSLRWAKLSISWFDTGVGEMRELGVLQEARVNGQLQGLSCQQAEEAREPTSCGPARGDENGCSLVLFQFLECPI